MRYLTTIFALLAVVACDSQAIPADIEARITPSRTWYHDGQPIQLDALVWDGNGVEIGDVEVIWTVEPAGAATEGAPLMDPRSASFTLTSEGRATFTACVAPSDPEREPSLCDSLSVRIDDGMPALEVESPIRGEELTGPEGIVVRGSVADRSMVNVYIDGTPAVVDEMGRFEGSVEAFFGVNHLVVSATDGLTDASEVEMDVLWAPEWTPALGRDGRPSLRLDDGLTIWLGQDFFDDGIPLDADTRPIETQDLADVLELMIASVDLGGLIPDPLVDRGPSFTVRVTEASIGEPRVEMDVTDDGIDLFLRVGRIEADTSGVIMIDTTSLPLTGSVSGSAVAFVHLTIRKDREVDDLEVTVSDLRVGLESLSGEFLSAETAAVFRLAEGVLRMTLETALVDALEGTLVASVPDLLRDALGAIDTALADQAIEVGTDPFPPVTLRIDARMRELRGTFRRDLSATLRTTVGSWTPSRFPRSRGVPRLTSAPPLPFVNEGSVQLGIRLALLNGLLHTIWATGMLDLDVTSILPASVSGLVSEARFFGRMQPVLRPPRADETAALILSFGQVELDMTFMDEPVSFGFSLDAAVSIDITESRIRVDVSETPVVRVWTRQAPSNPRLLTPETIETLLLDFWPDLRDSIVEGLSIDLPIPAVGDLGGLAPELAPLRLTLNTTDALRYRRGVLVMDAQLTGVLP